MSELSDALKQVINQNGWNWDTDKKAWKKNRTTKSHEEIYVEIIALDPKFEDHSKKEIISAIEEASIADINANLVDLTDLHEKLNNWQKAYQDLVNSRWSQFDEAAWKDVFYTLDQSGEKIIVARVSPSSKELRILGKTEDEVCESLVGIYVNSDRSRNRHAYIDNLLNQSIIGYCTAQTPGVGTPINAINGICLPASVANVLYQPLAMVEDHVHFDWKITFNKSSSYYPSVKSYIRNSMSAFLAREDKHIAEIQAVTNDPNVCAYTYINLNDYKEGPTLIWDTWGYHTFQNKGQYECFCTWIGSIFVAENTSKQACWLHGAGNMGLSKVQNSLYRVLGKYAVASFSGPCAFEGGFVNANVVGKRLVIVSDSKNENHIRKGVVHNWTGGDVISINQKHKQAFSMAVYLKALICENIPPTINFEQDNQMARILYFKLKVRSREEKIKMGVGKMENGEYVEIGNSEFQAQLDSQVNAWIYKCIQLYRKNCPTNAQIIPYPEHYSQIIANCADGESEELYDWLMDNIEVDADSSLLMSDLISAIKDANINSNNGYLMQSLNLMLAKYFQTSATKSNDRKKSYPGIRIKEGKKFVQMREVKPDPVSAPYTRQINVPESPANDNNW